MSTQLAAGLVLLRETTSSVQLPSLVLLLATLPLIQSESLRRSVLRILCWVIYAQLIIEIQMFNYDTDQIL